MGYGRHLATILIGVWLSCFCCVSQSPAIDLTYRGTSISVDIVGLGSASLKYSGSTYFDIETDGLVDGMPIGPTGKLSVSVVLGNTDGWKEDPQQPGTQIMQADIQNDSLTWNDGGWYDPHLLASGSTLIGGTIAGSGTYSITYGHNLFASVNVTVPYGNATGYNFWLNIGLSGTAMNGLSWNLDGLGGPGDNKDTAFDGGGAGTCSSQGLPTYWVNTSFLNLVLEDTDLAYPSYGHQVALRRVWNMFPNRSGMFGNGWTFAYESRLVAQAYTSGGARVTLGSGQVLDYTVSGSQGTGTVTVNYASASPGRQPLLTGYINQSTGTGYYLFYDKARKLTSRYDYVQSASDGYRYRLTSITDRSGNALTLTYDGSGRLTGLADASSRQVTFTYDGNGHCTGITVFNGQTASFAYDASGNLIRSTDLAGNITTYAYDSQNYPTAMTTAGKTSSFAYATGATGKVVGSVTNALGKTTTYALANGGTQVTDPGGGTRTYANVKGRTSTATNALGQTETTSYDDQSLPVSFRDADGRQTGFAYDANGNLTRITDPLGKETAFAYDADWNLTRLTNALNQAWTYAYDGKNNLVRVVSPLGATTDRTVNAQGLLTRLSLPDGAAYDFAHDVHGNPTAITDPLGNATSLAYDSAGLNLTSATDPRHYTTAYQFDANRRLTRKTLPDASTVQYGYDCCALSSITNGNGRATSLERDAVLHITRILDPLGQAIQWTYGNDGFLATSTDPLGRVTGYGRDAANRVTTVTNPLGKHVSLSLNPSGSPSAVANERGKTTYLTYDGRGLLQQTSDPLLHGSGTVARDDVGRVSSVTSIVSATYPPYQPHTPVTKVVSLAYDADGHLATKKYDSATVASYAWGTDGRLQSVTDASGTRTFTRDRAGRVSRIAYGDGQILGFAYDAAGNLASMAYPGGLTVSYTYDGRNQPTGIAFAAQTLSLSYDATNRLTGESRGNGVTSLYGYDAAGRLVSLSHKKGTTVVADLTYSRDAAGQIIAESGTWPLPPGPSGTTAAAVYDAADQLVTWKSNAYFYDTVGNLTNIRGGTTFDAAYDNENRPTSLTLGGKTRAYVYDGLGNRVRIQVGSTTRNLHHDPWGHVVFETDGSGQVTANYIYAGDRLVASGTTAGGFLFHHADKIGNTLALTNASGAVVGSYAYSPYGAVTSHGGTATTPFTYVGAFGVMDEGDGLYFMRNRYYDATTGRFIQRDPIGLAGGVNLYRYVDDNPVTQTDSLGLWRDEQICNSIDYHEYVRNLPDEDKIRMAVIGMAMVWGYVVMEMVAGEVVVTTASSVAGGAGTSACTAGTAGEVAALAESTATRELFRNSLLPGVDNASPVVNEFLWNTFRNNIPQITRGILSRGTRW